VSSRLDRIGATAEQQHRPSSFSSSAHLHLFYPSPPVPSFSPTRLDDNRCWLVGWLVLFRVILERRPRRVGQNVFCELPQRSTRLLVCERQIWSFPDSHRSSGGAQPSLIEYCTRDATATATFIHPSVARTYHEGGRHTADNNSSNHCPMRFD
jgi:hypothetical protein